MSDFESSSEAYQYGYEDGAAAALRGNPEPPSHLATYVDEDYLRGYEAGVADALEP